MKTGFTASKLGISGFIVPFLFVFNPELLLDGSLPNLLIAVPTALLGIAAISCALEGWIFSEQNPLFRIALLGGGLCLMIPGTVTDIIGIAICLPIVLLSKRYAKTHTRDTIFISEEELENKASQEAKTFKTEVLDNLDMES